MPLADFAPPGFEKRAARLSCARPLRCRGRAAAAFFARPCHDTQTWTPERVEQLKSCVVTGLTCSQIAAQIGVSRNAVIGKLHRLGLSSGRPPGGAARSCPPRAARPRAPSQRRLLRLMFSNGAPAAGSEASATNVDSAQPCSLLDLDRGRAARCPRWLRLL